MIEKSCKVKQIAYLKEFHCIADRCSDNCCVSNWVIDVTDDNKKLYDDQAPEIAGGVEAREGSGYRMKKTETADCVWFNEEKRICNVHANYGPKFLPDICYTFPRSYKKFDDQYFVTANMACPEIVRIALYTETKDAFCFPQKQVTEKFTKPDIGNFKGYEFKNVKNEKLFSIFNYVNNQIDNEEFSADQSMARLLLFANDLDQNPADSWFEIKEKLYDKADKSQISQISKDNIDSVIFEEALIEILEAIFILINRDRQRYNVILAAVKKHLGDNFDDPNQLWENYQKIKTKWQKDQKDNFEPILKNMLKAIISYHMFPTACYFVKKYHTAISIALHYIIVKVFLMCRNVQLKGKFSVTDVVDTVQPISKRFYVRKKQEIYDFCEKIGWNNVNKVITILLNL